MLGAEVRGAIERRDISQPGSGIAAWFLGLSDGRVVYTVNEAVCDTRHTRHYAESWFRLNAVLLIRPYGILLAAEVLQKIVALDEYTHLVV